MLPFVFAACDHNRDENDGNKVESLAVTTLAGEEISTITLEADNASFDFKVSVQPTGAFFDGSDFKVRLASGPVPDCLTFRTKTVTAGFAIITVADDGTFTGPTPYQHSVVVEHTPTKVTSKPFVITRLPEGQQKNFTLSVEKYPTTLKVGESAELVVAVTPSNRVLDTKRFSLQTDKGTASKYMEIEYVSDNDGLYTFHLIDKRSSYEAFSEILKIVYLEEQKTETRTFTVTSAAPLKVSKVYITLDQGYTRAKDIDGKTASINGYNDNGTNFQNHVKIDNREWIGATIRIEGADGLEDLEEMDANIKGRGNSTWNWEKKPYNIKLDSKAKVLGMKKHKRWCLLANAIDRTHLRNWLAYNISRQMSFDYAVHGEFIELYFTDANGTEDYRGLYFLTEHIKEDKSARVPLTEVKETETGIAGDQIGYLLEFDMNYDEPGRFLTATSTLPVNIKYPAKEDWTEAGNETQYNIYQNYISNYVSEVDRLINSLAEGGNSDAIWEKLDIESMANFWIVFEVMSCREVLWPKSIYFHKEVGEKLKAGPTWDFDYRTLNATDAQQWINHLNATTANTSTQYWSKKASRTWWAQLIKKDARFRAEIKKQWAVIYPKMQSIQATEFDEMKSLLEEADARNAAIWRQSSIGGNPNSDNAMTFGNAVNTLKSTFNTRITWLNNQISAW